MEHRPHLIRLALALLAVVLLAQAPRPMDPQQILARMLADTAGLRSYRVPVKIDAHVRHIVSISVPLAGTRYFEAPDREALKLNTVPAIAKPFQSVYASLGTPATWPATYNITEVTPSPDAGPNVYELRGVFKHPSNVDHILLDVDATTFAPVLARWYYKDGATVVMHVQEALYGKYRLPKHETVDVRFPQYSGSATVDYGDYVINEPIDASVFND
jgi:hypothetical protein